jgi:hypothetical protein
MSHGVFTGLSEPVRGVFVPSGGGGSVPAGVIGGATGGSVPAGVVGSKPAAKKR